MSGRRRLVASSARSLLPSVAMIASNGFSCGGLMSEGTAGDPRMSTIGVTSDLRAPVAARSSQIPERDATARRPRWCR